MKTKKITSGLLSGMILFLVLVFMTVPVSGQLQNHLIMMKNNYMSKVSFLTGDPITFIREGNNYLEESYIQGIGEDFILISGQTVPINNIAYLIRTRTGFNFRSSGKALMVAAPSYLIIGTVNALFAGVNIIPSVTSLIVAGSLLTTGAIIPVFQIRKYPIGKKFKLRIVPSDPALNR